MKLKLSAAVRCEGDWFVAWCPELDVASQGRTVEEALANLREALELYAEGQEADSPEDPFPPDGRHRSWSGCPSGGLVTS
jgi:predicted RNase H-like HicB family nuclease